MNYRILVVALAVVGFASAKDKVKLHSRDAYLGSLPQSTRPLEQPATGSLWSSASPIANMISDPVAHHVGDSVQVRVVEQTVTQAAGSVDTKRSFSATTGVSGIAGQVNTAGVQNIFTGQGSSKLQGSGTTASTSQVRTTLTGTIIATTGNGLLVVEAQRSVLVNGERQTVVMRGVVRPTDIAFDNSVLSTELANLELEIKGKGVISDQTRAPNILVRTLLRLIGF